MVKRTLTDGVKPKQPSRSIRSGMDNGAMPKQPPIKKTMKGGALPKQPPKTKK